MSVLIASQERAEGFHVQEAAWETVEKWSAVCQGFLDWQRREVLERKPSQEKLDQHRAGLKWMLRFARAIYLTASDPDYPDRRIAAELRGRLLQLEHSWRMVQEPMPDAEAEQLLREVFPQ
jgi:hypothetical protein